MRKNAAILLIASAALFAGAPLSARPQSDISSATAAHQPAKAESEQAVSDKTSTPENPAWIEIPEPSNLVMLALGIAGLVTGRYAARRRNTRS